MTTLGLALAGFLVTYLLIKLSASPTGRHTPPIQAPVSKEQLALMARIARQAHDRTIAQ